MSQTQQFGGSGTHLENKLQLLDEAGKEILLPAHPFCNACAQWKVYSRSGRPGTTHSALTCPMNERGCPAPAKNENKKV